PDAPLTEREEQLSRVPFFNGLTREALGLIARATTEESHATGTKIFQFGAPRRVAALGRRPRARALPAAGHHQRGLRRSPVPSQGPRVRGPLELRADPFG